MLTSYAPVSLYVSRRDREAFEISVVPGGRDPRSREPVRCGWRVVARRADVGHDRLAVVPESERPDVLADIRVAGAPEAPKVGEPAVAGLDAPVRPPEPPMPTPPEAVRADPAELER
jgi:hypothetical protein